MNAEEEYAREERIRGMAQELYEALRGYITAADACVKGDDDTRAMLEFGKADRVARFVLAKAEGK